MIRLMLADDEPMILRGLRKLLNWQEMGIEIVGAAGDGDEAWDMLRSCRPDILISDICMPGISGIELLKRLQGLPDAPKVIFLSGFQEFSYARDALTYGAVNYLLKPVDKQQLSESLSRAVAMLPVRTPVPSKAAAPEQALLELEKQETESQSWVYAPMLISPENLNVSEPADAGMRSLFLFSAHKQAERMLGGPENGIAFIREPYVAVVLRGGETLSRTGAEAFAEGLTGRLRAEGMPGARAGLGSMVHDTRGIPMAIREAEDVLAASWFEPDAAVLSPENTLRTDLRVEALHDVTRHLRREMVSRQPEGVSLQTQALMTVIRGVARGRKDAAVSFAMSSLTALCRDLSGVGLSWEPLTDGEERVLSALRETADFSALSRLMQRYMEDISQQLVKGGKSRESADIIRVRAYLEAHFSENVTLESAAAVACMTPSYFSSYFKKHTGENFKDVLIRMRLEAALKLLMNTDMKVYEISEQVGFNDSRHFSDMFRKSYGCTPLEYKGRGSAQPT